jgi:hypothetical protein
MERKGKLTRPNTCGFAEENRLACNVVTKLKSVTTALGKVPKQSCRLGVTTACPLAKNFLYDYSSIRIMAASCFTTSYGYRHDHWHVSPSLIDRIAKRKGNVASLSHPATEEAGCAHRQCRHTETGRCDNGNRTNDHPVQIMQVPTQKRL